MEQELISLLVKVNIPLNRAQEYEKLLRGQGIDSSLLLEQSWTHENLQETGIKLLGDRLRIIHRLKKIAEENNKNTAEGEPLETETLPPVNLLALLTDNTIGIPKERAEKIAKIFEDQTIDISLLHENLLTEDLLKEIGIELLGDRKRIETKIPKLSIQELKQFSYFEEVGNQTSEQISPTPSEKESNKVLEELQPLLNLEMSPKKLPEQTYTSASVPVQPNSPPRSSSSSSSSSKPSTPIDIPGGKKKKPRSENDSSKTGQSMKTSTKPSSNASKLSHSNQSNPIARSLNTSLSASTKSVSMPILGNPPSGSLKNEFTPETKSSLEISSQNENQNENQNETLNENENQTAQIVAPNDTNDINDFVEYHSKIIVVGEAGNHLFSNEISFLNLKK